MRREGRVLFSPGGQAIVPDFFQTAKFPMATIKSGMRRNLTAYGDEDFSLFLRRAFIKAMGYTDEALDRPIIGITDTFSEFNPCHSTVPNLIAESLTFLDSCASRRSR